MIYIYAIVHPTTKLRQYVGLTKRPDRRLWEHINGSHNASLNRWVDRLARQGLKPEIEILQKLATPELGATNELKWIARCKKDNPDLFNRVGVCKGDVAVTLTLPPDVDKLLNKMAGKRGVSRKQIVTDAIKLLAAQEVIKGVKS